ncbi:glycosyltransferase family 39 protein [Uliginosibacterium sp. 31-12]|uniref:glycosyltransferase family 39 protein n=1 Tax=Uliginosibacterium sp. 31-12 TaxID=3062781 RepID=UPI0026E1767B|nr:glycosyltransferase family 39 protein [Uliginosibacterium sp. 31-12]MDO6388030.1 glycosyltransferase family 39 protein [Uliginosibacterium sp. 31-12]
MEDWTRIRFASEEARPSTRLAQAWLLLLLLALLTAYRLWIIPRLGVTLYIDEAQYWTWAQHLDWGYFSKPPLVAWLIAASTAVFGDGLLAVKLPSLLLYPATAWLMFRLGEKLFDARIGFRTGLAFALIPIVSALGLAVSTDAPLLFCWAAAMLCLLHAIERDRLRDWLLLGAIVGIGIMAKYTMAAFAASATLYLLGDAKRRRVFAHPGLWAAIVLASLIVLPNIVWNWANDFPTLRHTADITHVSANDKSGNLGEFLLAQIGSLGPGFAFAFIGGLLLALRKWRDPRYQFVLAFSLPLLGLVFLQALRSEANGNWAAPALLTALLLSVKWLARLKNRWWVGAMALNIILMLGAYHLSDYFALRGQPQPAKLDPIKRAKGWDTLALEVRPLLAAHPGALLLAEDRTMMAHLLYELRDLKPEHAAWAPLPHPADHYQLSVPLRDEPSSRPMLLVTRNDNSSVASRFARSEQIARIVVEVEPGLKREASVLLLEGFRGYK